jgi:DNA-binding CsgD family transcriptional regulator
MSSGRTSVCIHDIADAEAFVYTMMRRALPTAILTPETREELLQTGMVLLQGMANKDKSQSGSGEHDGGSKFSGYASRFLPGKIRDAWHKMEGHTLRQGPEGKREWVINDKPVSLERIMEGQDESSADTIVQLRAPVDQLTPEVEKKNLERQLGIALDEQYAGLRSVTIQVALMLEEGLTQAQCAKRLGITDREVGAAVSRIMTITPSMAGLQVA